MAGLDQISKTQGPEKVQKLYSVHTFKGNFYILKKGEKI